MNYQPTVTKTVLNSDGENVNGKMILLSEPQFWFNLNTLKGMKDVNLSLGTEVEISNNSFGMTKVRITVSTLSLQWQLNGHSKQINRT